MTYKTGPPNGGFGQDEKGEYVCLLMLFLLITMSAASLRTTYVSPVSFNPKGENTLAVYDEEDRTPLTHPLLL